MVFRLPAGVRHPAGMADDLPDLDAGEIDSLVDEANDQAGVSDDQKEAVVAPADPPAAAPDKTADRTSSETEELLAKAEADLSEALSGDLDAAEAKDGEARPFEFRDLASGPGGGGPLPIAALQDVELDLRIELGRTELLIDDVTKLAEGSVVQLDKLAGDPVDILVNGRLIARGEVLVLNDNFCVRVAEILTPDV